MEFGIVACRMEGERNERERERRKKWGTEGRRGD
jgi:hypothetical protein